MCSDSLSNISKCTRSAPFIERLQMAPHIVFDIFLFTTKATLSAMVLFAIVHALLCIWSAILEMTCQLSPPKSRHGPLPFVLSCHSSGLSQLITLLSHSIDPFSLRDSRSFFFLKEISSWSSGWPSFLNLTIPRRCLKQSTVQLIRFFATPSNLDN